MLIFHAQASFSLEEKALKESMACRVDHLNSRRLTASSCLARFFFCSNSTKRSINSTLYFINEVVIESNACRT